MPAPPTDPTGRPSSRKHEVGQGTSLPNGKAEAGSHSKQPAQSQPLSPDSLSDIFNTEPTHQPLIGSDAAPLTGGPPSTSPFPLPPSDPDDAPTIITQRPNGGQPSPAAPIPLPVGGDPPKVAGRRLGNYELIDSIGAGGMAAVLRARDLELGRIVALKILPPESARDPESVTRFKQEARAAAMLDHENIARVYSCGEDQGLHFIAFEFVEGINLRVMIDRRGSIPARECVGYMIQVAAGLAHAAERSVVHRDIKPSNLVITPDGRVKIVDMGLARQLDTNPANGGVTQSGVTLGTFDYISPEQALDPRRADVRSDIYSLGCAFYHALTGRPPVPEGTAAQKLRAHEHTDPLDPRQINPTIPDELVLVLARMMAKDPARRYQTPEELIAHLKGLAERLKLSPEVFGEDSVVRAVASRTAAVPPPPRLRLAWVLGVATIAIAIVAVVLTSGSHQGTTPPPWAAPKTKPGVDPFAGLDKTGTPSPAPAVPDEAIVRTAEQFATKIADPETKRIELAPDAIIDLNALPNPVVFKGSSLEIVGRLSSPAVIRVNATPAEATAMTPRPGVFSISGATDFSVTGVRFEVVKPAWVDEMKASIGVGLLLPDTARITFADCVFSASHGFGAVRATRKDAQLRAERCLFSAPSFALWIPDRCSLTVFDCGFGPHEAAIQVGEQRANVETPVSPIQNAVVKLDRSSFLLTPESAVIRNLYPSNDAPGVRVTAGHCVFAVGTPAVSFFNGGNGGGNRPVLVRSVSDGTDTQFTGEPNRRNAYYGVLPLAISPDGVPRYLTFEECKLEKLPVADPAGVRLAQRPWFEAEPLFIVAGPTPWRAFRLKLTDAAVFTPLDEKVIGVQFYNPNVSPPRRAYPDPDMRWPPDPPKNSPTERRILVWYPEARELPLPKDTFDDLAALLRKVQPGDEIQIRHDGPVPVERVEVKPRAGADAATFRITFKPYEGCQPILTASGGRDLNQSLFMIHSGAVHFEGLQFLLKPSRPKDPQRVVAAQLVGAEGCTFTRCVFHMLGEDDAKAAAVLIDDPDKVMVMEGTARPTPKVKFDRCVIRGKGVGVWVPVSRAVEVDAVQSLTAIDGPLFLGEPGGKPTPGAKSFLRLNRVTAFVGGPIVELRGGKVGEMRTSGLVPLEVHSDECLFADVPFAGQPLVELDGIDSTEAKAVLEWKVQNANRYANFDEKAAVMVVRAGGDGAMTKELTWDQWITFAGEKDGKPVGKVVFGKAPTGLQDLAAIKPDDAAVKSVDFPDLTGAKPTDAGADVGKLPPVPNNEP